MTLDCVDGVSAEARRKQLIRSALRYAWWLGDRSSFARKLISLTGWRLSRKLSHWLGRPSGALAWPLGLAMLSTNAEPEILSKDLAWLERCFSLLINNSAQPSFPADHLDKGGIGYAALRLYEETGQARYLAFAETLAQRLSALPRTSEGWLAYAPGRQEILVDTLVFVCPFFTRMARITANTDLRDLALDQMDAMWSYGRLGGGWVFHGFDASSRQPLGMQGWGRGVAWLLVAIVDTLHELPQGSARALWRERCLALFDDLAKVQKTDGHWPWNLRDVTSASDSSVTSLVAYALARWHQLEPLEDHPAHTTMLNCARCALDAVTLPDGRVEQASGEAGGAGSYSPSFGNYLWAQAAAVATDRILAEIA